MRKILLLIFIFISGWVTAQTDDDYVPSDDSKPQEEEKEKEKPSPLIDRFYSGGSVDFQLSNNYLFFKLAPVLGYNLTKKFSVGTGLTYMYFKDYFYKESTSIYGGSIFSRYLIGDNLIAHAEYEMLSRDDISGFNRGRQIVPIFLVGAGYRQHFSKNSYFQILILFDLIDDDLSPYTGGRSIPLVFRTGFIFGI